MSNPNKIASQKDYSFPSEELYNEEPQFEKDVETFHGTSLPRL
jgi:hypothetical protein